jgi:hypothetical protein
MTIKIKSTGGNMTTPSLFLTKEEIADLTGRHVARAQLAALNAMGIEYKIRPNNTIAVLRDHILKVFDGAPDSSYQAKEIAPNWAALDAR